MSAACLPGASSARLHAPAAARRRVRRHSAALPPSACADCRRVALIPSAPRHATPVAAAHAAPAAGSTRLRALSRLASSAAAPDDAALDAYLDTLKWDDKGLLVAIAQACARLRARRSHARAA